MAKVELTLSIADLVDIIDDINSDGNKNVESSFGRKKMSNGHEVYVSWEKGKGTVTLSI